MKPRTYLWAQYSYSANRFVLAISFSLCGREQQAGEPHALYKPAFLGVGGQVKSGKVSRRVLGHVQHSWDGAGLLRPSPSHSRPFAHGLVLRYAEEARRPIGPISDEQ
eukprot:TRINITY_DN20150_c0_g1_i1.p1 TRINITY_DN20150_c0_g1~~TRINITY_DN20150_c0_g1_i1.p1  ORF type:complete len:108 (-),score=1.44 TRINITY_DN20150_c0_g1_i1:30-353(-)